METDEFGTVLFFVQSEPMCTRDGSDTGEAGFNEVRFSEMRVQFRGLGTIRVQFTMQATHYKTQVQLPQGAMLRHYGPT